MAKSVLKKINLVGDTLFYGTDGRRLPAPRSVLDDCWKARLPDKKLNAFAADEKRNANDEGVLVRYRKYMGNRGGAVKSLKAGRRETI